MVVGGDQFNPELRVGYLELDELLPQGLLQFRQHLLTLPVELFRRLLQLLAAFRHLRLEPLFRFGVVIRLLQLLPELLRLLQQSGLILHPVLLLERVQEVQPLADLLRPFRIVLHRLLFMQDLRGNVFQLNECALHPL